MVMFANPISLEISHLEASTDIRYAHAHKKSRIRQRNVVKLAYSMWTYLRTVFLGMVYKASVGVARQWEHGGGHVSENALLDTLKDMHYTHAQSHADVMSTVLKLAYSMRTCVRATLLYKVSIGALSSKGTVVYMFAFLTALETPLSMLTQTHIIRTHKVVKISRARLETPLQYVNVPEAHPL